MAVDQSTAVRAALQPFADFFVNGAPDSHVITAGSRFAKRQLTMGDCRFAAMALALLSTHEYVVGERTMALVFVRAGLPNLSDMQAVLDAVEVALVAAEAGAA